MKTALFFLFYFFTYSAAFACVASCAFARLRGGPAWLRMYVVWLVSAICFMLIRNGAFFAKRFMGYESIESTFAFYVLYMLTTAFFLGALSRNSLFLVMGARSRIADAVTLALVAIPLAFIPLLPALEGARPDAWLRLALIDVVMYFAFAAAVSVIAFLLVRLKGLPDPFARAIVRADLYGGVAYVILSVAQWFTYYDKPYSLDPFCVVNVSLFAMFMLSTVVVGREFLVADGPFARDLSATASGGDDRPASGLWGEDSGFLADSGLSEKERKIVALIKLGSTNQEIADAIGIRLPAVKSAIYRIFSRYGVSSRAALIHALESLRDGDAAKGDASNDGAANVARRRPEPVGQKPGQ